MNDALAFVTRLCDEAKDRVSLVERVGREVKLIGSGDERRSHCPLCLAGEKSGSTPFRVRVGKGRWDCYGCGEGGDVVKFEQLLRGGTALEACRELLQGGYLAQAPKAASAAAREDSAEDLAKRERRRKVAAELWASSVPLEGSLAWRYLAGRGIAEDVIGRAAGALRFHPFAKVHWDEDARAWVKAPAMLAQVVTPAGPTGAVHATYLRRDGAGRDKRLGKKMWAPQAGADGHPGGAWLIGPETPGWGDGAADLVVGEGIETALSVVTLAARQGRALRAAATLDLRRLQGGVLRDEDGCVDLDDPQPDLASPAFTWPNPEGAPWRRAIIAVDHDMGAVRVRARTGRGRPCWFTLEASARARLAGRLASAAWSREGVATRVAYPPPGLDFNDELRRVLARECVS